MIITVSPAIPEETFKRFDAGGTYLWLRTDFIYRDDRGTLFQILITGRYGRIIGENAGFVFPDHEIEPALWETENFERLRCLNYVESFGNPGEQLKCQK